MEEKEIEKWKKAGKLGAEVMAYAKKIIKPEMPLLEIAEQIEKKIKSLGATSAFPINLSINEIAAHSSPLHNDGTKASGLLKVDLGININGYISDLACSLDLTPEQKYKDLILASEYALKEAIKIIRPGIMLMEVGKIIQDTIATYNFASVRNLSGHELKPWKLHSGLTVPNYDNGNTTKLKEGMILAIEPFATTGEGIVQDGRQSGIYKFTSYEPTRDINARKILEFIEKEYKELPFSSRWLVKKFGTRALFSLRLLEQANALHHFKQLIEKTKSPVSQAEHTVLVTADGCEVLTKGE
ncbi:MAG: type II methionyl aminopeptidase [Candidatus Pacearchaeota archaeon]|nr:MAG: type II methionyl aminopeptidase [Candidatus Pacearchaeota archaeon]